MVYVLKRRFGKMHRISILIMLKGDCANSSLVHIYNCLNKTDFHIDICSASLSHNNIRFFNDSSIIKKINTIDINDYEALIVARNIYDYPIPYQKIINYKGVIIADHTTLNEGCNVFGDVVLVAGKNNYDLMLNGGVNVPTVSIGCLKSQKSFEQNNSPNFLWIESGHFPYGKKGRLQEVDTIVQICRSFPNYQLTVKPRYLPEYCSDVNHPNSDHIYKYLSAVKESLPNLKLIQNDVLLESEIKKASLVFHTYSSAFQEAVAMGKPIINIGDIETEETVDLRKNRYSLIKEYIDVAGCTLKRKDILNYLPKGLYCTENYSEYILGTEKKPREASAFIVEQVVKNREKNMLPDNRWFDSAYHVSYSTVDRLFVKSNRLKGYLYHLVAEYEYFLDDYSLFEKVKKHFCTNNSIDELVNEIKKTVNENFSYLNEDWYNQAFLMEIYYKNGSFNPCHSWPNLKNFGAFYYFSALYYYGVFQWQKCKTNLELFLESKNDRPYPISLTDRSQYVNNAICLLNKINSNK